MKTHINIIAAFVFAVGCTEPLPPREPQATVDWQTFVTSDGDRLQCTIENPELGIELGTPVPVVWDATVPRASWASIYPPMIRLRPDFLQYSPAIQRFAYFHECAHVNIGANESAANCWAAKHVVRYSMLTGDDWSELRDVLLREFPAAEGPYQSGAEQWRGIMKCAEDADRL